MQKVTENYLSKVTRYFYFVTEQHWYWLTVQMQEKFHLKFSKQRRKRFRQTNLTWSSVWQTSTYTKWR